MIHPWCAPTSTVNHCQACHRSLLVKPCILHDIILSWHPNYSWLTNSPWTHCWCKKKPPAVSWMDQPSGDAVTICLCHEGDESLTLQRCIDLHSHCSSRCCIDVSHQWSQIRRIMALRAAWSEGGRYSEQEETMSSPPRSCCDSGSQKAHMTSGEIGRFLVRSPKTPGIQNSCQFVLMGLLTLCIHLFTALQILLNFKGQWCLLEPRYHRAKSPVHRRATNNHLHLQTVWSLQLTSWFWTVGGRRRTSPSKKKKNMEHARIIIPAWNRTCNLEHFAHLIARHYHSLCDLLALKNVFRKIENCWVKNLKEKHVLQSFFSSGLSR